MSEVKPHRGFLNHQSKLPSSSVTAAVANAALPTTLAMVDVRHTTAPLAGVVGLPLMVGAAFGAEPGADGPDGFATFPQHSDE
jgi:hypothetical protein